MFRKQIEALDNKPNICWIDLKVIRQLKDLKKVVNKVKKLSEYKERQTVKTRSAYNILNFSSLEPRAVSEEKNVEQGIEAEYLFIYLFIN